MKKYPEKSKNEFYFLSNGKKLDFSSIEMNDLGIDEGTTFYAFEINPLFNKDLELEISVMVDEKKSMKKMSI